MVLAILDRNMVKIVLRASELGSTCALEAFWVDLEKSIFCHFLTIFEKIWWPGIGRLAGLASQGQRGFENANFEP